MLRQIFRRFYSGDEGFTLIETLITVALIGLVMAAGLGIYSVGLRLYNAGQNQTTMQFDLRRIAGFISDELRLASNVTILSEIPGPDDNVIDIYFEGEDIYVRRPYGEPTVLSTKGRGQLTGANFSSDSSKLVQFKLTALLDKQDYEIESSVVPLNLKTDTISGVSSGPALRLGSVGGGFNGALFAADEIDIQNGILTGEVFTNGNVNFNWGGQIKGNVALLGKSANPNTDIKKPNDSSETHITGEITTQLVERVFSVPKPVTMATPSKKGTLEYGWNDIPPSLTESGWYDAITVRNKMEIKVGNQDIYLRVDKFEVSGAGKVIISSTGTGIVKLYVNDFVMSGSSSINHAGDPSKLEIYYTGNKQLDLGGSVQISGLVDLGNQTIKLGGSANINGPVICRSQQEVRVEGGGVSDGLLYAPLAKVSVISGGNIKGVIICKSLVMNGGATITYVEPKLIPNSIKLN